MENHVEGVGVVVGVWNLERWIELHEGLVAAPCVVTDPSSVIGSPKATPSKSDTVRPPVAPTQVLTPIASIVTPEGTRTGAAM